MGGALGFLFSIAVAAAMLWAFTIILRKAGLSPWWAAVMIVPLVNVVMVWVFAWARWPNLPEGVTGPPA